jgi:predicted amino acid-binding ACT domain protein
MRAGLRIGASASRRAIPTLIATPRLTCARRSHERFITTASCGGDALLIKVSGTDKVGITAKFTEMLDAAGVEFHDIDQPWCQPWCTNNLSLYFLVGMPQPGVQEASFLKNVLDRSKREGVQVDFEVVSRGDVQSTSALREMPQGDKATPRSPASRLHVN